MLRLTLFVAAVASSLLCALLFLPAPVLSRYETDWQTLTGLQRYQLQTQVRGAILQAFGAIVLVVGAVTAVRQLGLSRAQNELDRRAKLVDAFSRAVEQLASGSDSSSVAGIYALDRIAQLDPAESNRIKEVLSAYLRETSTDRGTPVLEAAMQVCVRLNSKDDPINLEGAPLAKVNLRTLDLSYMKLSGADLRSADLRGCRLIDTDLSQADLTRARLEGADLTDVDVRDARTVGVRIDLNTINPPALIEKR